MSGLITGKVLFRDLNGQHKDKKLFLLMGQLWVPADVEVKSEHRYLIIGSDYVLKEPQLMSMMGFQVLLNGEEDISRETKKKHPSQLVSLLHTDRP